MSVPLVGQNPREKLQQLQAQVTAMLAPAIGEELARQFFNDVQIRGVGPAVILEQKRSPLDIAPQQICVPGALLLDFAAKVVGADARGQLAELGIRLGS